MACSSVLAENQWPVGKYLKGGPTTGAASDDLATETQSSLDDEEQEAALKALFADEEEKEPAFQAAITSEVADRTLAAKKNSKRKIVRF
ncbi:hypothetical protein CFIMG_008711RA00001 [Ceratocystis fimbriata CBS 114723]|uniref:Uncharacterized protein n=1 Tax=Ceratocystis fimbriata CBS 114723 TaxID=1035309 RepID=A0A2C5WZP7_9PEZI|nr:hypothetical protein CFIMG_008711RA00001 [Ceratocystis fimbriata CBS 114723]